jgi:hypothetical protein
VTHVNAQTPVRQRYTGAQCATLTHLTKNMSPLSFLQLHLAAKLGHTEAVRILLRFVVPAQAKHTKHTLSRLLDGGSLPWLLCGISAGAFSKPKDNQGRAPVCLVPRDKVCTYNSGPQQPADGLGC